MGYNLTCKFETRYSLVVGRNGIKNRTHKGEVIIGWNDFVSIGILENVFIKGVRGSYHTFVYISNTAFDEKEYRRTIQKSESKYYIGGNGEILIAISVSDLAEAEILKLKIQEYVDKYANKTNSEQ